MSYFLIINSGYINFEIGLYENNSLISHIKESNKKISKELITIISSLLSKNNLSIENLSYIAANQGPAPFTSLRAILTTLNGITYVKNIPLIGVNGIEALFKQEQNLLENKNVIIMLNAFCQDIYYAIKKNDQIYFGSENIKSFLNDITYSKTDTIYFLGNGAVLNQDLIKSLFPNSIIEEKELYLNVIADIANKKWLKGVINKELMPIYLKN